MRRVFSLLVPIALAALFGCQRRTPPPPGSAGAPATATIAAPPAAAPPDPAPATAGDSGAAAKNAPPFAGTAGIIEKKRPKAAVAVLSDVRAATHPGYDRVVFEFEGGSLPGYHVEYVDRPVHRCGSGQVVEVAGDGWLRVRLEPAAAHDDRGRATIAEADRQRKLQLDVLREQVLTCDFEAQVVWVLGVGSPNRYRVLELERPPRLVVDIRHR